MNDVAGLLVDGFDRPPSILLPYNHPYYAEYLERWGFERAMTMWAFYVHEAYINKDRMERGAADRDAAQPRHHRPLARPEPVRRSDVAAAMRIYNEAWAENWGHVPYTEHEALHLAGEMKPIIEKDLFLFAELDGEPIAFAASLPNLNQALRHLPRGRLASLGLPKVLGTWKLGGIYEIRMALMGVLPEHRNLGLDALLIHHTIVNGQRDGYQAAELSWVLDTNKPLVNALEKLGCTRDKEYAMFQASAVGDVRSEAPARVRDSVAALPRRGRRAATIRARGPPRARGGPGHDGARWPPHRTGRIFADVPPATSPLSHASSDRRRRAREPAASCPRRARLARRDRRRGHARLGPARAVVLRA